PLLPLLAFGLFLYWTFHYQNRSLHDRRSGYYIVVTAALSGLLVSVITVRADIIHFMYLLPLFGLPLAWILEGTDIPGRLFKKTHAVICVYLVLSFAGFAISLLSRAATASNSIETRRGRINTPVPDTVLPYIQAHVSAGDGILVYPYLPLYYYLTGTVNPARYDFFQPGMNTA